MKAVLGRRGRAGNSIWRDRPDDLCGATIASGHHMAEQAPEELATAVIEVLRTPTGLFAVGTRHERRLTAVP